jgi:hypothetical protein
MIEWIGLATPSHELILKFVVHVVADESEQDLQSILFGVARGPKAVEDFSVLDDDSLPLGFKIHDGDDFSGRAHTQDGHVCFLLH